MVAGWSCLGLGGAVLVSSGVVGGLTLSKVSQYDDTGNTDVELYDEAVTLKTTTNALLGVGAGFAVVGAVLLVVDAVGGDTSDVSATHDGFVLRF